MSSWTDDWKSALRTIAQGTLDTGLDQVEGLTAVPRAINGVEKRLAHRLVMPASDCEQDPEQTAGSVCRVLDVLAEPPGEMAYVVGLATGNWAPPGTPRSVLAAFTPRGVG